MKIESFLIGGYQFFFVDEKQTLIALAYTYELSQIEISRWFILLKYIVGR